MRRFKSHLPFVIRPDVIPTRNGMIATELDSIPGGIGFTASLGERYGKLGCDIVGGADGMVTKERLCRTRDSVKIQLLEARGKAAQHQLTPALHLSVVWVRLHGSDGDRSCARLCRPLPASDPGRR